MTNRPWPTNIIVWSRDRTIRLLGLAALMVLTFAVDGPVARPEAYATLAEAIAATVPAGSFTQAA